MGTSRVQPSQAERPFAIDELFFSMTDMRGVIRTGNSVFSRVSGYSMAELVGKPHNIIRHPDMPRAAFHLLWSYLQAGKPVAAYVKNLAKDGAHYWVMALVIPIRDGYLSLRFKPSSPFFPIVRALYSELLKVEKSYGAPPGARQDGMLAAVKKLGVELRARGFADYDAFMQAAISAELRSRDELIHSLKPAPSARLGGEDELVGVLDECCSLQKALSAEFSIVEELLALDCKLGDKSRFLFELAGGIHLVFLNAMIKSVRLEEVGRVLAVVADSMARRSDASAGYIEDMTESIHGLQSALGRMAFAIASAKLQVEMMVFFTQELLRAGSDDCAADHGDVEPAEANLETLVRSLARQVECVSALRREIIGPAEALSVGAQGLERELKALGFVHISGKVEAARLGAAGALGTLFDEVFERVHAAQAELLEFARELESLQGHVGSFSESEAALSTHVGGLHERISALASHDLTLAA